MNCSSAPTSYSAQWVGIDGYSSNTVEQDGTSADCSGGTPQYGAWYEMYGDNSVNSGYEVALSGADTVSAGNTMTASVSVSGTTWTLAISDSSGWSFSTNISYSGAAKSSAEWIVERPEVCNPNCALTSLANFGTVSFSAASTSTSGSSGSISSYSDQDIEMVNGATVLALPSGLGSGGSNFSDTWEASGSNGFTFQF